MIERIAIVLIVLYQADVAVAEIGFDERYERDYNIFNPVQQYPPDNPLNPANAYHPDSTFNPVNRYDPGNPANPVNKYSPNNPFNPVNQYHPDNPLNPANKYNPDVPFEPLDKRGSRGQKHGNGRNEAGERLYLPVSAAWSTYCSSPWRPSWSAQLQR
ncbi:MAG: hypothetical protein KF693_00695 [Nitrospira sp.]|nr:hypothetical protein [Nitrospira sp.]